MAFWRMEDSVAEIRKSQISSGLNAKNGRITQVQVGDLSFFWRGCDGWTVPAIVIGIEKFVVNILHNRRKMTAHKCRVCHALQRIAMREIETIPTNREDSLEQQAPKVGRPCPYNAQPEC